MRGPKFLLAFGVHRKVADREIAETAALTGLQTDEGVERLGCTRVFLERGHVTGLGFRLNLTG